MSSYRSVTVSVTANALRPSPETIRTPRNTSPSVLMPPPPPYNARHIRRARTYKACKSRHAGYLAPPFTTGHIYTTLYYRTYKACKSRHAGYLAPLFTTGHIYTTLYYRTYKACKSRHAGYLAPLFAAYTHKAYHYSQHTHIRRTASCSIHT